MTLLPSQYNLLWVEEFPLFSLNEQGAIESTHHPFTAPFTEDLNELLHGDPLKVFIGYSSPVLLLKTSHQTQGSWTAL
jgi:aspartyl-tRNA synthetase